MEENGIITVDVNEVGMLVARGQDIVMRPEAEAALLKLLELEELIGAAVKNAKAAIEKSALEYNPNFTSVQGDRIKVGYQFFGQKYAIDEAYLDKLPSNLYKQEVKYSPIGKAIDEFVKTHKRLPQGIRERERSRTITLKTIDKFADVDMEAAPADMVAEPSDADGLFE